MSLEEKIQKARDFLLAIPSNGGGGASAIILFEGNDIVKLQSQACHASFQPRVYRDLKYHEPPIEVMGSAITLKEENKDIAERFIKWISGKKSPWKLLFDNGLELVQDDNGLYKGFLIYGKNVKKVPFHLVKNLAIVCRSLTEHIGRWKLWMILVNDKKMTEVDAWYLISCFNPYGGPTVSPVDKDFKILGLNFSDVRSGGHWGLSDSSAVRIYSTKEIEAVFDFQRARAGNVNLLPNPPVNGFFCSTIPGRIGFKVPSGVEQKKAGGRFSTGMYYDTDEIINEFYKWQDQEGVLA